MAAIKTAKRTRVRPANRAASSQLQTISDVSPRPNRRTPAVVRTLAAELVKKLGALARLSNQGASEMKEAMADALTYAPTLDGYDMARYLQDRHQWEPNSALVKILNESEALMIIHVNSAVVDWIRHTPVKAEYAIGDKAIFRVIEKSVEAVIWKIDIREAMYFVTVCEDGTQVKIGFEYALSRVQP